MLMTVIGFQETPNLVQGRQTQLPQERHVPPPTRASHRSDGVIPRGQGTLSIARANTATGYFPRPQRRDSSLSAVCAVLRSSLRRGGSNCTGKLDETRPSICKWFPSADTAVCPILEDVRLSRGL